MSNRTHSSLWAFCAICAVGLLTWFIYHDGTRSPFLLDDFSNLSSLGETGPINSTSALLRYATSGTADPTGRPISVLSFLIDAQNWPADPAPFKRTNILLHIFNGLLLGWFLLALGRASGFLKSTREIAAVLASALWLLHPLFVSTTLYVVQREAMLPATFILVTFIAYLGARGRALRGHEDGVWLAGVALFFGTLLATLSKANGALLPLLVWLVESVLLQPAALMPSGKIGRRFNMMRLLCLVIPSMAVLAFVAKMSISGWIAGVPPGREWSIGQRLLTEMRVLVDYISALAWPGPYSGGLFNDGYIVSTGMLTPPATLACTVMIAALVGFAMAWRKRFPVVCLSVLFFFVGHLMESTTLPLELYFAHRNYVPAILAFWPLALLVGGWQMAGDSRNHSATQAPGPEAVARFAMPRVAIRYGLALALIAGFAGMTYLNVRLWSRPVEQAEIWANLNPGSPRAQAYAARRELESGDETAVVRLDKALRDHPDDISLALNFLGARCLFGGIDPGALQRAAFALRTSRTIGRLGYEWFDQGLLVAKEGTCAGLDLDSFSALVAAAQQNSTGQQIPDRRQDLLNLQGNIAIASHDPPQALTKFNAALDANPQPGAALSQAALLGEAGFQDLALQHLSYFEKTWQPLKGLNFSMQSLHRWILWKQGYWQHEIDHLRAQLQSDVDIARIQDATPKSGHETGARP